MNVLAKADNALPDPKELEDDELEKIRSRCSSLAGKARKAKSTRQPRSGRNSARCLLKSLLLISILVITE